MTVNEALDLIAKYGNVSSSPNELRLQTPTETQLIRAIARCHNAVCEAERVVREYYFKPIGDT